MSDIKKILISLIMVIVYSNAQAITLEKANNNTILVKNNTNEVSYPIYPAYISNMKNNNLIIIKDSCGYLSLKPKETCLITYNSLNTEKLKIQTLIDEKEYLVNIEKNINNLNKKNKNYTVNLNYKQNYIKLGLGYEYDFEYKTENEDVNFILDNKKIRDVIVNCENNICTYKFKLTQTKESYKKLVFENQTKEINFILRKSEDISLAKEKMSRYSLLEDVLFLEEYISGYPKKTVIDDSLINVVKSKKTINNLYIKAIFNNQEQKEFNISLYEIYPFSKKELVVKEGDSKIINLDLFPEYKKIINYGNIKFIGESNVSVLGVGLLENYGNIEFEIDSQIIQEKLSILYEKEEYSKLRFMCKKGETCLFIQSHYPVINKGSILKNGYNVYHNFQIKDLKYKKQELINSKVELENKKDNRDFKTYIKIAFDATIYFLMIFTLGIILFEFLPKWLRFERINKSINARMSFKYLSVSYLNIIFGVPALIFTLVFPLEELGYLKWYTDMNEYSVFWYYAGFVLSVIMHDFYFYWLHRLLHTKFMYRYVHYFHHKAKNTDSGVSFYFHFVETYLQFAYMVFLVLIFPIHVHAVYFFVAWMILQNAYGHSGYYLIPKKISKHPIVAKYMHFGPEHFHHHSSNKGFYGLYSRFWDSILNTADKTYKDTLD